MTNLNNIKGFSYQLLEPKRLGITDDVTTCDCCGKTGLKATVVFKIKEENDWSFELRSSLMSEGLTEGYAFLGSSCAQSVPMYCHYEANKKQSNKKINIQEFKLNNDFSITGKAGSNGQLNVGFRYSSETRGLYFVAHNGDERRLQYPTEFADLFNKISFNRQDVINFLETLSLDDWGQLCVEAVF